jgi:subtilisin family serine protease
MRKATSLIAALILALAVAPPARSAAARAFVLRTSPAANVSDVARRHRIDVVANLDARGVFLVTPSEGNAATFESLASELLLDVEVLDVEPNRSVFLPEAPRAAAVGLTQSTAHILEAVANLTLVDFYGAPARDAYVNQPAAALVRTARTQRSLATGLGIVAIIDTGVDANHPVLRDSLVGGYDFTRDLPGIPNEIDDLTQSTAHILEQSTAHILEQSTAHILEAQTAQILNGSTLALLDQSTAHILEGTPLPSAFGHGTMVAGIVHLVAPTAKIMPLKAFYADGTTDLSHILRAIYYATDHGADVINMSFSLPEESSELRQAIEYAVRRGVLCVAASGNEGLVTKRYPASLNNVVGVASTDLLDQQSVFSNSGSGVADLAAPGEEIITTFPAGLYAAGWGTSFSAPFVAGAAALLNQTDPGIGYGDFVSALSHGAKLSSGNFGWGRLDAYSAVASSVK